MTAPLLPDAPSFVLSNARVHASLSRGLQAKTDRDGFALVDIHVAAGKVTRLSARDGRPVGATAADLAGRIVFPCFVDCHTHIDKGHIWPRKPNPDGTFNSALEAAGEDRFARWNATDLARRMDFSLRSAYAHGTKALRTHLDSIAPQEAVSWPVFEEMRERWRGRIELQAAALVGIEEVRRTDWFEALAVRVAAARGVLGAVTYMVPDLVPLLDRVFLTASRLGLDLDFHADETGDADATSLRRIAEAALRHRFEGSILVGHCCSLSRQHEKDVDETLDKVAAAGLSVVSLPMCNLYLQDRRIDGTTPRWRGVTLLHEMRSRGIPVAVASDNTRDPFHAYGDLDMLEVLRMAARVLHLDHPVGGWPAAVAATPATIMRLAGTGTIEKGGAADFVIFRGRNWTEIMSRPESERIVVRDGRAVRRAIPDYAELDDLMTE